MAKVEDLFEAQRSIEASLSSRMDIYEKSLKLAASSDNKPGLEELSKDFKNFRDMAWSVLQAMRSQIRALSLQVDDIDTYNRRNALLFSGIPESDSEDCIVAVISVINSTMNISDIKSDAIQLCHRLGAKKTTGCRPILVRFTNLRLRNYIWVEKKRLKSSPTVISEFLTKTRQAVFSTARSHFGIRSCWTRDGAVFVKLPNDDRKRIASMEELDLLIKKFPAALPGLPTSVPITASVMASRPQAGLPAPTAASGSLPPPVTRKVASRRANK